MSENNKKTQRVEWGFFDFHVIRLDEYKEFKISAYDSHWEILGHRKDGKIELLDAHVESAEMAMKLLKKVLNGGNDD